MARTDIEAPARAPSRSRALLKWGLAGAALLGGFADLWRGGTTIGPILLVLAYCVLIPVAILD
jgi:hypothetical protein